MRQLVCAPTLPGQPIRIATACSGTDIGVLVFRKLVEFLSKNFQRDLALKHLYSCDKCPAARQFIQCLRPLPEQLYTDIAHLLEGVAYDELSQSWVEAGDNAQVQGYRANTCSLDFRLHMIWP